MNLFFGNLHHELTKFGKLVLISNRSSNFDGIGWNEGLEMELLLAIRTNLPNFVKSGAIAKEKG